MTKKEHKEWKQTFKSIDKTLIKKAWHLKNALNDHFGDNTYKDMHDVVLSDDVVKEIDELVAFIKLEY